MLGLRRVRARTRHNRNHNSNRVRHTRHRDNDTPKNFATIYSMRCHSARRRRAPPRSTVRGNIEKITGRTRHARYVGSGRQRHYTVTGEARLVLVRVRYRRNMTPTTRDRHRPITVQPIIGG